MDTIEYATFHYDKEEVETALGCSVVRLQATVPD